MNPNQDQNPFADILQGLQQRRMQDMQQAAPQTQPAPPANAGNQNEMPQPVTALGVNNKSTVSLVSALSQMNNFIKSSQNRNDIASAQIIISLLSQLINQDRTAQTNIQQVG